MTNAEFHKLVESRFAKLRSTLGVKAEEYATDTDRLHNFKEAGNLKKSIPSDMCLSFAMKHIISIVDIVKNLSDGGVVTKEMIDEKIGDTMNYMLLLEACITEQMQEKGFWK